MDLSNDTSVSRLKRKSAIITASAAKKFGGRRCFRFTGYGADFDLQIFRGGKLRFEIQEVSKEGYAL